MQQKELLKAKEKKVVTGNGMTKNKLLIIDISNIFIKNYCANAAISTAGVPIGGLKGTLLSIQKAVEIIKPDEIIICYDGERGSVRRKLQNSDYKQGRSPLRLKRSGTALSDSDELNNNVWQLERLISYLNEMPIIQLMFSGVEADDLIAYVSNHPKYFDWNKIILSDDKDFIQLCDDHTILYRSTKEEFVTRKTILEKFEIHPNNFALARALAGDISDNIDGVGGIGLKTAAKRFPFLKEQKTCTTKDLITYSKEQIEKKSKIQAYKVVVDSENKISENYQIMQLYSPSIPVQDKIQITQILSNFEYQLNKTKILTDLIKDGIGDTYLSNLFINLNNIITENK